MYRDELEKGCFAHDAQYSECKALAERTISDKTLKYRAHEIARNRTYYYIKEHQPVWAICFLTGAGISISEQTSLRSS